jgi:uncharacterized protein
MTAIPRSPIVDIDIHLAETAADLAPYCDMPWRLALQSNDPSDRSETHAPWSLRDKTYPSLLDPPIPPLPARTPAALDERLDASGVDRAIVLPGTLLRVGHVYTPEYVAALARAYNRWLTGEWLGRADRVYGAVLAVPHDPEDAAREIEQYAAHERIVAVVLPTSSVDPLWGHRKYDPIYAAAEAANLPVIYHGVAGLMMPGSQHLVPPFANDFEAEPMGQSLVAIANLNRIVGTGVPMRFPNLRMIFLGSGITWLMHIMLRFDKEYLEVRRDVPWYPDRISHTLRRQVWVGTQPMEGDGNPGGMDELIRISCGIERVVYGSDWPHVGFDSPERVRGVLIDDEAARRVLGGNAVELFDFDKHGATRDHAS